MKKRSQDQQRVGRSVLFHAMIGTLHQWKQGDGGECVCVCVWDEWLLTKGNIII